MPLNEYPTEYPAEFPPIMPWPGVMMPGMVADLLPSVMHSDPDPRFRYLPPSDRPKNDWPPDDETTAWHMN